MEYIVLSLHSARGHRHSAQHTELVRSHDSAKSLVTAWSQHMTLDVYGMPLPYSLLEV